MRTIHNKTEFVRTVRSLKKIRREFETVNQRCQQDISRLGFYFIELINPTFSDEIHEHSISVVFHRDYGTMLVYGMTPQYAGLGKQKVRLYGIRVEIPDFYVVKKDGEEDVKDKEEVVEERKVRDPFDDFNEMAEYRPKTVKSKLKSKSIVDYGRQRGYIVNNVEPIYGNMDINGDIMPVPDEAPMPEAIPPAPIVNEEVDRVVDDFLYGYDDGDGDFEF